MKNFIASVVALMIGFFTITFAAVMGLFIGIAALVAKPFIKKRMTAAYEEALKQQGYQTQQQSGSTIDGEFEDVTKRPAMQ
ncbi:hypothetical protein C9J48_05570 [Photobacterium profundum]|uniref:Uncharacterized protein n=1 Tax=Photobacterium profundum 3TCK TaxID=314280 RepID=Q1Z725_9GAMM|nr:hypothetical protein [Photobacterium profundum]EAS44278.1 hypothetical protein P3TCK_06082 [Photobacterium profundum 3TCK]PSV62964.1 hypothetical protein C9J48_05570 [Photobacterium profundum]